jgi:hypothetical protein
MVVANQYPMGSEAPSVFGCGYAALCIIQVENTALASKYSILTADCATKR